MSPPFRSVARDTVLGTDLAKPSGTPEEVFTQLLDAAIAQLAPENAEALGAPPDELHQEILLPLLPAMLADKSIRGHWREQKASGFAARLQSHLDSGAPRPAWAADDFEIHVTASYSAQPDARALADTLLSEEPLRGMAADLMNQILGRVWGELPRAAAATAEVPAEAEASEMETVGILAEIPAEAADMLAETSGEDTLPFPVAPVWQSGFVTRARPFRPQPWQTRRNPLAAAGNKSDPRFANPMARNPLEQRAEPRHVWRLLEVT